MADLSLPSTAFVTFYSFKGGVGRSMTLINVAGILAGRGFRVLVMDMDLEAPGISFLEGVQPEHPGFVDVLLDAVERGRQADLFSRPPVELVERYSYRYGLPESVVEVEGGLLRIMPAGRFGDGRYQVRLDRLGLGRRYREGSGKPLVTAIKTVIREARSFDLVLIDSRTGFSDESGVCTRDLGDHLVVVMGLNRQNVEGTANFFGALRASGAGPQSVRVVVSPVPHGEDDLVDEREAVASRRLTEAWGEPIEPSVRIPYHPRLALTEEPHIFRSHRGYLYDAYRRCERMVLQMLGYGWRSIERQILLAVKAGRRGDVIQGIELLGKTGGLSTTRSSYVILALRAQWADPDNSALRQAMLPWLSRGSPLLKIVAMELGDRGLDDAAMFFERLVDEQCTDAEAVHEYACFLEFTRADYDEAERMYRRAAELEPEDADYVTSYAKFLEEVRGDYDAVDRWYGRALESATVQVRHLCDYAEFLEDVRRDYDGAEQLYARALEQEPDALLVLRSYALFRDRIRRDHGGAQSLYERVLQQVPTDLSTLKPYADLLVRVRQDYDGAERLYRRALGLSPDDCELLSGYAALLGFVRRDYDEAERHYQRILELEPQESEHLVDLARFLFVTERGDQAREILERAFEQGTADADVRGKLHLLACTHAPSHYPGSLAALGELLGHAALSEGGFSFFERDVRVARESGHPDPDLVEALGRVVAGEATVDTLASFVSWSQGQFQVEPGAPAGSNESG